MATAVGQLLLVLPLALASKGLTTISIGSCDAADYAGGARTMMEFARGDRSGFLGLKEVVSVQSVDNFFDYWLRINHFTPSALIAFNGSVFHCAPHELTSIMTLVIFVGALPVVFWFARVVAGLRRNAASIATALYALSPVLWYAVAQVSPGQLLAAPAIALITWAGFALWRALAVGGAWRRIASFAGVLAIAYWLLLGSYNFFVLVCLVPALAYAGGRALRGWQMRRFVGWLGGVLGPLAVTAAFAFARVAGLAERFTLLRTYDFGWKITPLTPEGWLGFLLDDVTFAPLAIAWRIVLALGTVGLVVAAVWRRGERAWRAITVTVPILVPYAYLQWRGAALGTNASYDAYKLLAVFFPGVLAVGLLWLDWVDGRGMRRFVATTLLLVVGIGHAQSLSQYFHVLKNPPLRVTFDLRDVRQVEAMPDVNSVNVLLPDMWSRLWANELLLRKPQYFLTHTYEARLNTPLRGDWDLESGVLRVVLPGTATREVTATVTLVDTRHGAFVRASLPEPQIAAEGWHLEESDLMTRTRWRWTSDDARIRVHNPHAYPLTLVCTLDGHAAEGRELVLAREEGAATAPVRVGVERATIVFAPLELPPGDSVLVLRSPQPPTQLPGDPRALGVCVFRLTFAPRAP